MVRLCCELHFTSVFFSVPCQDFQTHGVLAQDLLTKGVLAELLDQLLSFMTKHDLTKTSSTYYS